MRYASLTPDPQEEVNTFECVVNKDALAIGRVHLVRKATRVEMDKAAALWKREHAPKTPLGGMSCMFPDGSSNAVIEIEVLDGRMDIWCDRKIAVENVASLQVNIRTFFVIFHYLSNTSFHSQTHTHTHTHNTQIRRSTLPRKIRNKNYSQRFVRAIVDVSSVSSILCNSVVRED